ncbi:MAG: hypothetical protein HY228_01635 [Candidatus Yonathbacteria bacterium]|nr:hypothetical protein [Candidatus Yonathbacteria bacterium]
MEQVKNEGLKQIIALYAIVKRFLVALNIRLSQRFIFPFEGRFTLAFKSFSSRERKLFFGVVSVFSITTIILLFLVNQAFLVKVPSSGGILIEGVLNTPAHINPLLSTGEISSEADRDITALVYSGLLRSDGKGGFIPDLAESYKVSKDWLTYTFTLKNNLTWHDGEEINADDVVFTIKTAQDSRMKSPKRANWDGVGVEQVDKLTVRFTLKKPYPPFLENTTMGILPEHIWRTIDFNRFDTNKYNREPIGSGPYQIDRVDTITKDGDSIPVSYTLKAFKHFVLGRPYIDTIKFIFSSSEDNLIRMLRSGEINSVNSISPEQGKILSESGFRVEHTPLPRVLAVFFNQNQAPIFINPSVRKALALSVDKQAIINNVLAGYGITLDSPIPPGTINYEDSAPEKPLAERLLSAKDILEKDGWKWSEKDSLWTKKVKKEILTLSFTISTSETPELKMVAEELKTAWGKLGVPTEIRVFATGDFKETIIRPRKFDALFFGQVFGHDGDAFPFWHSSQRVDPGLNIASYANARVDKLLDDARGETNPLRRKKLYEDFRKEIELDTPAIFIYAPEFLYVVPEKVNGVSFESIMIPSERFLNVYKWYINTDNIWKIFIKEKENVS